MEEEDENPNCEFGYLRIGDGLMIVSVYKVVLCLFDSILKSKAMRLPRVPRPEKVPQCTAMPNRATPR